jgi:dolichol-phosphate mannosyltransferase
VTAPVPSKPSSARGAWPSVSVIVPTFREVDNLPELIERLDAVRQAADLDLELLIVDDNSRDGTSELVARLAVPWVRLLVRTDERGLSSAVVHGLRHATREITLVMDADLSHPPERIPDMLAALASGAEFVIGSRYVPGAVTDEHWGLFRWVNSKVATLLARPFTWARDPMAGFFACRRAALPDPAILNPIGYKIGLELLVKGGFRAVAEVPIHFADRRHGQSKLSLAEQVRYVQHLWRLLVFRYPRTARGLSALTAAAVAAMPNLAVIVVGLLAGVAFEAALVAAILAGGAVETLVFSRITPDRPRVGFSAIALLRAAAMLANAAVALWSWRTWGFTPIPAALTGIGVGAAVSFVVEWCRSPLDKNERGAAR